MVKRKIYKRLLLLHLKMPQATLESVLSLKQGPLAEILPLFEPASLKHAHEVHAFRETHPEARNIYTRTADFSMYRVEHDESSQQGNEAFLYFARLPHNLIFRNVVEAAKQLRKPGNYVPPKEGIDEVVEAAKQRQALRIRIKDLNLQKDNPNDDYGHFDVDPDNLDSLNPAQKSFVQAIYGSSRPGNRVYVLDSSYVKKQLKGKEDSAIARASRLGGADLGSWFDADGRGVDDAFDGLLGVLKEAPKAPQKIEEKPVVDYTNVFEQAKLNPLEAVRHLNDATARGLLNVVNLYYNPQK